MGKTRWASEGPRRPRSGRCREGDAARSPGGGIRENVPAGGGANARGRKGAQSNQGTRTRRGQGRAENPGNGGAVGGTEQVKGRGSDARDRGQSRAPSGPGSGGRKADQGSRRVASLPSGGQRSPRAPRTRTRNGTTSDESDSGVGSGPIHRPRERSQHVTERPGEGGAHPGVRPVGSRRLPPPGSGSRKSGQRRTRQGAKCGRGGEGEGCTSQGRSRRPSQARRKGRRTEREGVRAEGPARETRCPIEGPLGPRSHADGERSSRSRARSRIGEGFPRGCGTGPRSGDGPEGDQRTRTRPGESREETPRDGRRARQTRASEGGDPRAGTRRSPQASPGPRPRKHEARQGGRGPAGVPAGRQRRPGTSRTRARCGKHSCEGGTRIRGAPIRRARGRSQRLAERTRQIDPRL